jgi:hypothetical protein
VRISERVRATHEPSRAASRVAIGAIALGLPLALALSGAACLASTLPSDTASPSQQQSVATTWVGGGKGSDKNAPEISRSTGEQGGIVILWPRVFPKSDPELLDLAAKLQKRLETLARQAFPDAPIDVRPEPERVCPRQGCDAIALGIVVTKKENGCAAAALVAKPGPSPSEIVPWVGKITVTSPAPFREPAESYMKVHEFGACAKVQDALLTNAPAGEDPAVVEAIKAAKP